MKNIRLIVALWVALAALSISGKSAPVLDGQTPALGSSATEIKKDGDLELGELYKRGTIRSVTVTNPVSVNAIVLTSANVPVTALSDGITVEGVAGASNTTAATVALDGLTVTTLRDMDGNALVGGEVVTGRQFRLRYNASASQWRFVAGSAPLTSITGMGTGINAALAVNAGTAGAPVINGAALGTPSSGSAANLTGLPLTGLANEGANTILGNATAGSAAPTALAAPSCSTSASALKYTTSTGFGCNTAIAAATVTTNANLTGDVTSAGNATTIASAAVTLAKMANLAANSFICNNTGSGATPIACTVAQAKTLLAIVRADVTDWGTGVQTALGNATNAASGLVTKDANSNISANSFLTNFATTATAAGTTTLTVSSPPLQFFTGSTTQTVVLPVASTLVLGQPYIIINQSSGSLTLNSSGGNLVQTIAAGNTFHAYAVLITGTTASSWGGYYVSSGAGSGTMGNVTITAGTNITTSGTCTSTTTISCTIAALPANSVRQTVSYGPVSSSLPNFLPATSASLSITSQNVSSSPPLVVTAAQGANSSGQLDYTSVSTSNITWTSVTASNTNYLYVNASTGATGFTTLVPIYQYGGTPAVTNGQFTFNIGEMTGYMGNGTTAPATPLVFVGEVVAGASTITSTVAYSYNGFYDSGYVATLPGVAASFSKSSNLGIADALATLFVKVTTAEGNYSIGDIFLNPTQNGGTYAQPIPIVIGRNTTSFIGGGGAGAWTFINKTTGIPYSPTLADYALRLIVKRSW